ncbi:MAG: glycosyltransferase [Solirubrobacterales bacterium]|nr:glycosyltransferase [Solirubrobacterales bacterium]
MRICLIYDCLFPWTVGGAERRMRVLAEALAQHGHDVTYLTRRQWPPDEPPDLPGVRVIAVSRDEPLYGPDGNRTIGEPVRFGAGVLKHLLDHGKDYDVVHTVAFPFFSLLAAGAARRRGGYRILSDWYEVWSPEYWKQYVGGPQAIVARTIQRACARVRQDAFVFSRLHAERLIAEGLKGEPTVLWGEWARSDDPDGVPEPHAPSPATQQVVFAGRHIAEKQAPLAVEAIARAAARVPGLTGVILGDGPQRPDVLQTIDRLQAHDVVSAPGFVNADVLAATMRGALCLLAPTRREGYGLVVIEAAALGVPVVVAAGADNAAVELVDDGVNGFVCHDDSVDALADALVRVHEAGPALRRSTAAWYAAHVKRVAEQDPLRRILAAYDTR